MRRRRLRIGLLGLLGIAAVLAGSSGCAGFRGAPSRWTDESGYAPGPSNVVRKPVYERRSSAKPFYLGGYAGTSY